MYGSTKGDTSSAKASLLADSSQQNYQQPGADGQATQGTAQTISTQALPKDMGWSYNAKDPMPSAPPFEAVQEKYEATEGAELKPSTGDGWCGSSSSVHIQSIIASLVFLAGIVGSIYYSSQGGSSTTCMVMFVVAYIIYLIECFVSKTMRYLRNVGSPDDVERYKDKMRCVAPIFWWKIQCYHYDTEIYYDSQGNSRTRTTRVNTHFARGYFRYHAFMDKSLLLPNLRAYFMTRLDFDVRTAFGDQHTQGEYARQLEFFRCVNMRDTHYDFYSGIELPGMKKHMLCEAEPGARPMFMSLKWFVIFSFLGLSLFYRFWMDSKTGKCCFHFQKEIYCRPQYVQMISQTQVVNVNVVMPPTAPNVPQNRPTPNIPQNRPTSNIPQNRPMPDIVPDQSEGVPQTSTRVYSDDPDYM